MEAHQHELIYFRARRENTAADSFCCDSPLVFAFHPAFIFHKDAALHEHEKGNRSGKWRKNTTFLDLLEETGLLQPKCVTDDHTWLLRSVSDPTRRECWSQAGQRTVRTERTGWRTSRASIPFWLTLTQECNPPNVFVRLSVGGRKLWLLLFILLGPPEPWEKSDFTRIYG